MIFLDMAQPPHDGSTEQTEKTHKAREKAIKLYPQETWRQIEERIFIASSREPKGKQQKHILEKELVQARMLTAYGSTVYLLPEIVDPANLGVKHPDAVVDGFLMEFKTISGSINQVEHRFQESRKKADRVFFNIQSPLTQEAVLRKLIDKVRKKHYQGGMVIAHFNETDKTYFWDIDRLQ
jgi:hypothetical protein